MIRRCSLILLWLVLPAWGQFRPLSEAGPKQYGTDMLTVAELTRALDEYAETLPLYEWVTVAVDSANVGVGDSLGCQERPAPCPNAMQGGLSTLALCYDQWHEWAYSKKMTESVKIPRDGWTMMGLPWRERICRHCLRHEYQVRREVAPPPSAFDALKARLR